MSHYPQTAVSPRWIGKERPAVRGVAEIPQARRGTTVTLTCHCCGEAFARWGSQVPKGFAFKNAEHRKRWRAQTR